MFVQSVTSLFRTRRLAAGTEAPAVVSAPTTERDSETVSTHLAARPQWTCGGCGLPWPCLTRRRELLAEYSGSHVSLALYLSSCLVESSRDLPREPAGDLYMRFLGWIRGELVGNG